MTTEEKLNALKVISNAKDILDQRILDLEGVQPDQINFVQINHNGKPIMLTETVSRHLHAMLSSMLHIEKGRLINRAKELMS